MRNRTGKEKRKQLPQAEDKTVKPIEIDWFPEINSGVAFLCFLLVQTLSSTFNYISDCDETFNYWEPTHFLQYGRGLQTWEYSPEYALRSYAYLWPQVLFGRVGQALGMSKVHQFYLIRWFLGLICALCMTYFYGGVKQRYNHYVSLYTFWFLLVSTGMFISGTAYLPSSFAMYCLMVSHGAWLRLQPRYPIAIFSVALASLLGWPFAALVGLPLAIDVLLKKGITYFIFWGALSGILCLIPSILIDYRAYGKFVVAFWNILVYNVFSQVEGGSELYGTEPWYFYLANALLNLNLILLFALVALPIVTFSFFQKSPVSWWDFSTILYQVSFPLWLIFMSSIHHKEERFLFVIYPHACLAGAISFNMIIYFIRQLFKVSWVPVSWVVLITITTICLSRTASIELNYNAPLQLYGHLSQVELKTDKCFHSNQVNICVGSEWYRFPGSYFLPEKNHNLTFIRHGPTSQLPQYYPSSSKEILPNFNALNKEEKSRYIALESCHYIIDKHSKEERIERYPGDSWTLVKSFPFLDPEHSSRLFRILYIPYFWKQKNSWHEYYLLKNSKCEKINYN